MSLIWNDKTISDFATAFLAYAKLKAPQTADNPAAADSIAETIIPGDYLDCVAVFDPGVPAAIDYATNSNAKGNLVADRQLNLIVDRTDGKHAEMKILDYLDEPPSYIGISKRCCLLSDLALNIAGVGRRGCDGKLVDQWKFPDYISRYPKRLEKFLGPVAYRIYIQLSLESQREARRLVEINLKQYDKPEET